MSNPIHAKCNTFAKSISSTTYDIKIKGGRYSVIPNVYCCSKCNVIFQPGCKNEIVIPIVVKEKK